jgi:hypothetical protein
MEGAALPQVDRISVSVPWIANKCRRLKAIGHFDAALSGRIVPNSAFPGLKRWAKVFVPPSENIRTTDNA